MTHHQTLSDPLVERYAVAVASRLPADQRDDVAAELRASILDSVEDRLDRDPDAARDAVVREVLLDLGDPIVLARGYATAPRYLVGPENFDTWRTLVLVISAVGAPVTALATLVARIWAGDPYPEAILGSLWTGFTVVVHVAFWVTLVFWIMEHTGTRSPMATEEGWTLDRLPELPRARALGLKELIAGLGFVTIVLAWLPWQHVHSPVVDDNGDRVPLLDPALWSSGWLWGFVALLLATAAVEVVKYRAGDWTTGVTLSAVALDVVTAAYLVLLLTTQTVVNPALDPGGSAPAAADTIVLVTALVVAALGIGEAVRGHLRHRTAVS
ncbi:HAAS signaling domain-containing protein [Nocardioides euryhalodurans]|uniref:Uncharacterized protein n=1 Tax=Nocardioides euryhalodurans TaxID=2518370 RepID=A0A4P7GP29_9ACTN|nr:hypothetical protein [Nocardioides euryhalodurans]QBR93988.1 hypothetical protein EXE57_18150 [Nocardioides euryhalodurans]